MRMEPRPTLWERMRRQSVAQHLRRPRWVNRGDIALFRGKGWPVVRRPTGIWRWKQLRYETRFPWRRPARYSLKPAAPPCYPTFMDEWPPLEIRMRRQRLPQYWRGRRWVKRRHISRVRRNGRIVGMVLSDPPGARDRCLPHPLHRRQQRGVEHIVIGFAPIRGRRPSFPELPPKAIRAFNAAMRAFREAQDQT